MILSVMSFFYCQLSSAALAFFNVFTVRSEESETGIQVFNSNGDPVGFSKAAGEKVKKGSIYLLDCWKTLFAHIMLKEQ